MIEEKRRIESCWHDYGKNGLPLFLTRHDEGAGPVYRVENMFGEQLSWNNEAEAKRRAAEILLEHGHKCSDKCRGWAPIEN